MIVLDAIIQSIRTCAEYNKNVESRPHVILWTDEDKQWEGILPVIQEKLPELYTLGEYSPENKKGPAIWLRCVIAGKIEEAPIPESKIPILYLPGVSRQMLRAVETCEQRLKPLAELQYRGRIWSGVNGRDWTILAYLVSKKGLGLDVSKDEETKRTLLLSLPKLISENVENFKGKQIQKSYLMSLLSGDDPIREMLNWLNDSETFQRQKNSAEWEIFADISKTKFAIDPEKDGIFTGATRLLEQKGIWKGVWERFYENPKLFPGLIELIKKLPTPVFDLFPDIEKAGCLPHWNSEQEEKLRIDLLSLRDCPWHEVDNKILEMEKRHGGRRKQIWAKIGESKLAEALEYLVGLSENAKLPINVGTIEDISRTYQANGWKVDYALLKCLSLIDSQKNEEAIHIAIRSIYLPWAEESANHLQKQIQMSGYPLSKEKGRQEGFSEGEAVLFVDGLRFDTAKMLSEILEKKGLKIDEKVRWSALPTVTATGKAAVSPIQEKISGEIGNIEFEPSIE
ncbi:MAG: BREX-1 system phosphatase PglZ type B, partial [Leptospiraceae bacterium]|nr:BREX-1 system phosphatase PglZ type B [Leptospiraceae bacterium]